MPNYKGHLIGGFFTYLALLYLLRNHSPTVLTIGEWLFFTLMGALFPDIDTKSKGQKFFYRVVFVLLLLLLVQMRFQVIAFVSFVALFPLLIRHRGITHSLWFIMGLSLCTIALAHICVPNFAAIVFFDTLFFFVGALSHLILDLGLRKVFKVG